MSKSRIYLFIALFTATLMGCEKYEAGGLISKGEENLLQTWKLQQYLRNNTDATASMLISNYEETYQANNSHPRTYINKDKKSISESGTWKLDNEKKVIQISGVSSIEITSQSGTISASNRTITKLTASEFWYTFVNGGDKHEFRMVKK
jgi:hypothetical protein